MRMVVRVVNVPLGYVHVEGRNMGRGPGVGRVHSELFDRRG